MEKYEYEVMENDLNKMFKEYRDIVGSNNITRYLYLFNNVSILCYKYRDYPICSMFKKLHDNIFNDIRNLK